jgi:hypothetical protein
MLDLALDMPRRRRPLGGSVAAPVLSTVAASGWAGEMTVPADLALASVALSRQGFDASGAAVTLGGSVLTTKRVRLPFPNQATLSANGVALSDYVYATDSITGVANGSTETSPKPVAAWGLVDRKIVGNTLTLEVIAFHRNAQAGQPVAAVEFRATDGTATVTAVVSAMTISPEPTLGGTVLVYRAALDISALADATTITANARVFPHIGGAAAVLDSADSSDTRGFAPRLYRKNVSRAVSPPLVHVAAGGNDTTGYVGTDAALAAASPCLTVTGAINRARTVLGTATGSLDGLRVRLTEGTWVLSASPTANTLNSGAEAVIEPAPGAAKANTIYEFGAANLAPGVNQLRHRGLTVRRMGAFYPYNTTGYCSFDDCVLDFNGNTGAVTGAATVLHFVNTAFQGLAGSVLNAGTPIIATVRGCSGAFASGQQVETFKIIGCAFTGSLRSAWGARSPSGGIIAYNSFLNGGSASGNSFGVTSAALIDGFAIVQNVFEWTSATSNPMAWLKADGSVAGTRHMLFWHNTLAGFNDHGRSNILYNEGATAQSHTLASFIGNVHVQANTKHDVFMSDGTRTGGWAYLHGVGCRGEFTRYRDAGSGSFAQDYAGLDASIGTVSSGAGNDPLFTDYRGTTTAAAAGAGGGTYTLQGGSPARARVAASPLPFDLAGAARSGTVAAGAYV